jgi:hypothetical protein
VGSNAHSGTGEARAQRAHLVFDTAADSTPSARRSRGAIDPEAGAARGAGAKTGGQVRQEGGGARTCEESGWQAGEEGRAQEGAQAGQEGGAQAASSVQGQTGKEVGAPALAAPGHAGYRGGGRWGGRPCSFPHAGRG